MYAPFNLLWVIVSHFRGGGLRTSFTRIFMLAEVFILWVGPPKSYRLKGRGQIG